MEIINSLNQLIGQNQAVELLKQAIASDRISPAYLFVGYDGIGKTSAAKGFAQLLLSKNQLISQHSNIQKKLSSGNHPDFLVVEPTHIHQGQLLTTNEANAKGVLRKAPPKIRIEQIREITQFLARPPLEALLSIVIIQEAQTMAEAAANALLKTLEEPGKATIIMIAPTAHVLLPTLVSRCQRIPFTQLSQENLLQVLQQQGYDEIISQPELIAIAQGSPGKAIAAWEHFQQIPPELTVKLKKFPQNALNALLLAKEIEGELDNQTQLWLIDYLQYCYWQQWQNKAIIETLEKARQALLSYVSPRLVWEFALLSIFS